VGGQPVAKKKMGRPSLFNEALKKQILKMYEHSLKDSEVAEIVGISERTLEDWKKSNPDFLRSLKEVKEVADSMVEATLLQRATGYSAKATKVFLNKNGEVVTHEYIEHYPPDPTSMIFWLKNRQPDKWREKQDIDLNDSKITIKIDSDDEKA
jgi:hypothetical protein